MDRMAESLLTRRHITVKGVVQGVGFRPFVFRLALEHGLKGWVCNTSRAVEIEVEGSGGDVAVFSAALERETPPLARIQSVEIREGRFQGYESFEIKESRREPGYQLISADIATCPECLGEIFDPRDRRYRYPFTNCTNCGPRFTIIQDIPYDRDSTTMRSFEMCADCSSEYHNPLDRRFHAQPNACPRCGPALHLLDSAGMTIENEDP